MDDADGMRFVTHVLVTAQTDGAGAAAQPRIDHARIAHLDAFGLRTDGCHLAQNFVSRRAGQFDATVKDVQFLAAAKVIFAFPQMQIGMTDAAMADLDQHFSALRNRVGLRNFLERFARLGDGPEFHDVLSATNIR